MLFPRLRATSFRITSPEDKGYNCVAWAARNAEANWEPDPLRLYYWPRSVPRGYSLETYIQVFESLGYARSDDSALESGVEKVAVFARGGAFRHVARQLPSGMWTSKLGTDEDIEHELDALVGEEYGAVVAIMRRALPE